MKNLDEKNNSKVKKVNESMKVKKYKIEDNLDLYDFEGGQAFNDNEVNKKDSKNIAKFNKKNNDVKNKKIKTKTKFKIKTKMKSKLKNKEDNQEDDIAIKMTNKNKVKQEEQKRKKMTKEMSRKKRIKKLIKKICIFLLLVIITVCGIIFLLTSSVFNIQNIEVVGLNTLSSATVINLSGINIDDNIFKTLKSKAEYNIVKNSYVESVTITRKFPNTILISVEERVAKFIIEKNGENIYIDKNTYILEKVTDNTLGLLRIVGIHTETEELIEGNQLSKEDINIFNEVYEILNAANQYDIENKITYIDITDENEYYLSMENDGFNIYIGDNTNLSTKMMYIVAIMEQNAGISGTIYVNGDFNNNFRAYFRKDV